MGTALLAMMVFTLAGLVLLSVLARLKGLL
jgi:hypothetical protein